MLIKILRQGANALLTVGGLGLLLSDLRIISMQPDIFFLMIGAGFGFHVAIMVSFGFFLSILIRYGSLHFISYEDEKHTKLADLQDKHNIVPRRVEND